MNTQHTYELKSYRGHGIVWVGPSGELGRNQYTDLLDVVRAAKAKGCKTFKVEPFNARYETLANEVRKALEVLV